MGYVIAAYTFAWAMIIGYGICLFSRFKRLRNFRAPEEGDDE